MLAVTNNRRKTRKKAPLNNEKVRLVSLGGVGEIGKNMFAFEYEQEIVVIDGGLKFPEEDMLGVDIVIPDISYLVENQKKVAAILLTHGHEDHIGGLPYILKQLSIPVYGTKLTLGILEGKLKEKGMLAECDLRQIRPGMKLQVTENIQAEFFVVNHSIPDAVGICLRTPAGLIVHCGDFKIDHTPVDGRVMDFNRLAQYGEEGVLAALIDSTNAERPGFTQSETKVGETISEVLRLSDNRVILATFASNVHRIQQVLNAAAEHKRKVAVNGRSMVNVVGIAMELGYLKDDHHVLVEVEEAIKMPPHKVVLLTTGSQGEPMSGLSRMAAGEHRKVDIVPGDTVIFAANPIPGNEKLVSRTIDNLFRLGADVIYESVSGTHVSGHASQEEIKLILSLLKPKYAIPVHGEYRHCIHFQKLATAQGIPLSNVPIIKIGELWEFSASDAKHVSTVPSGQVMVDGLGIGDVGNIVLRDRKQLSMDGILIVVLALEKATGKVLSGPDIVSRGFVYVRESEDLMAEARDVIRGYLSEKGTQTEWSVIKSGIRDCLGKFLYDKTRRSPMIMPIIMEV
ncbi:MAG TPA: ribonuclease J [Firmicutes bacterium]|jgi:ribonuclease J|nr:ribonuclease J [Bacillota bacterium]HCX77776.1 ribonuclease J [Bacillota bacterium]